MTKHILPVFIPHVGCPHQCVFCDQRSISGAAEPVTPRQVAAAVEQALRRSGPGAELAFYGGSFTAIDPAAQEALLAAAQDRGLPVIGGLALLHAQAELAFELFVGE